MIHNYNESDNRLASLLFHSKIEPLQCPHDIESNLGS